MGSHHVNTILVSVQAADGVLEWATPVYPEYCWCLRWLRFSQTGFCLFFNMTVGSLLSNGHRQSKEDFGMWCNTTIHIMGVQLSNLQQLWWCHINVDQNLMNVSAPCWVDAAKNYNNYAGDRGTSSLYLIMWLLTVDEWLKSPNFIAAWLIKIIDGKAFESIVPENDDALKQLK